MPKAAALFREDEVRLRLLKSQPKPYAQMKANTKPNRLGSKNSATNPE